MVETVLQRGKVLGHPDSKHRPRLMFINRSYWPDVEATGQLLTELCEDLAEDFEVTVLCGQPRTVADEVPPDAVEQPNRNGVRIRRVRHTRFDKASFVGRLSNMLTFQVAASCAALTAPRAEVVIVETDPPFLCLLGRILQLVRGSRLVCYLQDIYPDVAVALGKLRKGLAARLLRAAFFHVYRRSDAIVVLSRDMRELLIAGGVQPGIMQIVPNWIDTQAVSPIKRNNRFRRIHGLENKFVVMYSGNMGLSQRLDQVLDAAEALRHREDILLALVGDGADRRPLERSATQRRLKNVRFFDYQPKDQLADSLSAADVHLVILRPEIKRLLMPSKLYGVLASGTPALVIADADCELARTVSEHDLGAVVAPDSTQELVQTICRLADAREIVQRQSLAARAFAETHCRRDTSVGQIRGLLQGLVPPAHIARVTQVAASRI
jgi:glycosyltransferase involved in cell wall biosynthesis